MFKKILTGLIIVLLTVLSLLIFIVIKNSKKEAISINSIVDENKNNEYFIKDETTGVIEYKTKTMTINIIPIKKKSPKLEMWEVNIKLNKGEQIKSAFAGDEFSLDKKEKTSDIAKRHSAIPVSYTHLTLPTILLV